MIRNKIYFCRACGSVFESSDIVCIHCGTLSFVTPVEYGRLKTALPPYITPRDAKKALAKKVQLTSDIRTLGYGCFSDDCDLETIVLPGSITDVTDHSFSYCKKLKEVVLQPGIETIGSNAFKHCVSLETVVIPNSLKTIKGNAFSGCKKLKSIILPDSVRTIEAGAFSGCKALKTVTLPKGLKRIEDSVFQDCQALEGIVLPDRLSAIGKFAFSNCKRLGTVILPGLLKEIGEYAFNNCNIHFASVPPSLEKVGVDFLGISRDAVCLVSKESQIKRLNQNNRYQFRVVDIREWMIAENGIVGDEILFWRNGSETCISIPEGIRVIGPHAFDGMDMVQVHCPRSLRIIRGGAFSKCNQLQILDLPQGVETIEDYAFTDCLLKEVDLPETAVNVSKEAFNPYTSITVSGTPLPVFELKRKAEQTVKNALSAIDVKCATMARLNLKREANDRSVQAAQNRIAERAPSISKASNDARMSEDLLERVHHEIDAPLQESVAEVAGIQNLLNDLNTERKSLEEIRNNASVFAFSQKKKATRRLEELADEISKQDELLKTAMSKRTVLEERVKTAETDYANRKQELDKLLAETDDDNAKIRDLTKNNASIQKELVILSDEVANSQRKIEEINNTLEEKLDERKKEYLVRKKENEKEILIRSVGQCDYEEITAPLIDDEVTITSDEKQLNQAFGEMISIANRMAMEKQRHKFYIAHQDEFERIKTLNAELGLDEYGGIEYIEGVETLKKAKLAGQYLPEWFLYLNNFFERMASWKAFLRCAKNKAKKAKTLQAKFFSDKNHLELVSDLNGTTPETTYMLYPYCVVSFTRDSAFRLLFYDDIKVTSRFKEQDVEDEMGTGKPPAGKEILAQQYLYANADGSPNKRYKHNPLVFKTRESWILIKIGNGKARKVYMDTLADAERFAECFKKHVKSLHSGNEGEVYQAICNHVDLTDIKAIIEAQEHELKLQREEQQRQLEELKRRRREQQLAEEKEKEKQRQAIIERQKRINEERKAEQRAARERQRKIRSMFVDDAEDMFAEQSESKQPAIKEEKAGVFSVTSKRKITNNVFKVVCEVASDSAEEKALMYFTDMNGNVISNKKTVSIGKNGDELKVGFVLNSGIDFTRMKKCILKVERSQEGCDEIIFEMNISYFSDF